MGVAEKALNDYVLVRCYSSHSRATPSCLGNDDDVLKWAFESEPSV